MKRKRLLIFGAGVLCLTAVWRAGVYAQTLAGTGAAIGAGATLGAAGGAGLMTPSQYAAPATGALNRAGQGMGEADGQGGGAAGTEAAGAGGGGAEAVAVRKPSPPLNWGTESGDDLVRQLTSTPRRATNRAARRAPRLTRAQRTRLARAGYRKPAVGYLSWYLPEDRYKLNSKVWQFVTTPNDRFYYRAWAPAMRLRSPSRVIGFHTWQDAMIAGYRPDPVSKPEPGPQLTYLASLTRGPMLSTYFEYVYAGQITPAVFDANLRYVRYVANTVNSQRHTRHLVGDTVEKVLGAAMGQNELPRSVGAAPQPQVAAAGTTAPMPVASGGTPMGAQAGNADNREAAYNQFGNRAGGLAR